MNTEPINEAGSAIDPDTLQRTLDAVKDPEVHCIATLIRDSGPIHQAVLTFDSEWIAFLRTKGLDGDAMIGTDSGARRIRAVVHRARTVWRLPIASDRRGYWFPKTVEEADAFLRALQRRATASAVASISTAKKMRDCFARPQRDVLAGLMEEAIAHVQESEEQATALWGIVGKQRQEIETLKARLAKWGRPSDKRRMERNETSQPKLELATV